MICVPSKADTGISGHNDLMLQSIISTTPPEKIVNEAFGRAQRIAAQLGLEYFSYGALIRTLGGNREIMRNNYPQGWDDYYMVSGFKMCDPVIHHALSSSVARIWSKEMFDSNIKARQLYAEFTSIIGIRTGITIPVRDHLNNIASVNFSGCIKDSTSFWTEMLIGRLTLVAQNLHAEVVKTYCNELRFQIKPDLTPRETEILRIAAEGKTTCEASRMCGISESTVEYRLTNIRSKLDACNTVQAVFKATRLNLL